MSLVFSFFLPDFRGGGAERVNLLLMQEFIAKGHVVNLVLLSKNGVLLEQVPPEVTVIDLRANRIRQGFIPLIRYLKDYAPDAILASMWPLTTLTVIASKVARFRGRVVVSEHSALSQSPQNSGLSGFALRMSMRWINGHADALVGVSSGVIADLRGLGLPARRGDVIHNPVFISDESASPEFWSAHPWYKTPRSHRLLAVGSLKPAKDYPALLSAVKMLVESGRHVSLLILGTGPLQRELEEHRRSQGLEEHVHFGGFVSDPGPFYRAAGLFILSSAWEGFGNVIVEALAAGTPVVSTDCRSGPAEILENGRYGRLVPVGDYEVMAEAIAESLASTHDTDALKGRAADFSVGKIGKMYLKVLTP